MSMIEAQPNDLSTPVDPQAEAQARELKIDRLRALGGKLKRDFDNRVNERRAVEQRWLEDLRLYNCMYDPNVLSQITENKGSKVFLSIGRTKTDAVEAHHSNLLLPTDERNWEINPTQIPNAAPLMASQAQIHTTPEGNPVTAGDMVDALHDAVAAACDKMRQTIDDQLVECDYSAQVRRTLHQGCVLGTGVMRGPVIKNRRAKKWSRIDPTAVSPWAKQSVKDKRPAIENINVWDFYPSSGIGDIKQSEGEFVRYWISKQQLREMKFDDDVMQDELATLLEQHEIAPPITNQNIIDLRHLNGENAIQQNSFEMVEYVGVVDTKDLIAIGVEIEDDPLTSYRASIFMVEGVPIKGALDLMEECQEKEFYVWQLAQDDTSIWGRGVPRLMRTSVLVANAIMRMMIDNAGLSVGGQLIYDTTKITPSDGDPRMTPRKVWFTDGTQPIRNVFEIIEIPMQLEWMMPLFNLAIKLADEESALPMIAQGDQAAHVTKTKGGMSMLMDAAGVMLRRSIKNFDDNVTVPVIDAMYSWNMLYNPDGTIKGDFSTKARGASAMLEREAQMNSFTQFVAFLNSNPIFSKAANWPAILEEGARLLRVNRGNLLMPADKIKAMVDQMQANPTAPQPAPVVQAAEIRARVMEANANVSAQAAIAVANIKAGVDHEKTAALIDSLAQELGLEREKIQQALGLHAMTEDNVNKRFNADVALKSQLGSGVP